MWDVLCNADCDEREFIRALPPEDVRRTYLLGGWAAPGLRVTPGVALFNEDFLRNTDRFLQRNLPVPVEQSPVARQFLV